MGVSGWGQEQQDRWGRARPWSDATHHPAALTHAAVNIANDDHTSIACGCLRQLGVKVPGQRVACGTGGGARAKSRRALHAPDNPRPSQQGVLCVRWAREEARRAMRCAAITAAAVPTTVSTPTLRPCISTGVSGGKGIGTLHLHDHTAAAAAFGALGAGRAHACERSVSAPPLLLPRTIVGWGSVLCGRGVAARAWKRCSPRVRHVLAACATPRPCLSRLSCGLPQSPPNPALQHHCSGARAPAAAQPC